MSKPKATLRHQIFEIRYERGYRYLDRCGDVMVVLEDLLGAETNKTWMPDDATPKGAQIKCPELDLMLTFDTQRLVLEQQPVDLECDFKGIVAAALATITGRFDLRLFSRLGYRRVHWVAADSIEEAREMAIKYAPIQQVVLVDTGMRQHETEFMIEVENEDASFGYRYSLGTAFKFDAPVDRDMRLTTPPRLLPKGQREALINQLRRRKATENDPEAGMKIDIDFYSLKPQKIDIDGFVARCVAAEPKIIDAILGFKK